jgi:hypothetical protein
MDTPLPEAGYSFAGYIKIIKTGGAISKASQFQQRAIGSKGVSYEPERSSSGISRVGGNMNNHARRLILAKSENIVK